MTVRVTRKRAAKLVLRLFAAGDSPNSTAARTNLGKAIAHLTSDEVSLEVIDVLRSAERGLADGVLVTPTLIKVAPAPERRIIGNLRDHVALLAFLGLQEADEG